MLSAAPPPFSSRKTSSSLLRDVQVLYRRVCVLRVSGKTEEADELLAGKVASAISIARESGEISEQKLEAIFATEEERVDTAHALAEILLPLLTAAQGTASVARPFPSSRFVDAAPQTEGARSVDAPVGTSSGADNAGNSGPMLPGIADFIDEMLTQERAPAGERNLRRPA